MKKIYQTSEKARGKFGYWKHLRKYGKRLVNKATRKNGKVNYV